MNFKLGLAGLCIGITCLFDETYKYCKDYIVSDSEKYDFSVCITPSDITSERTYSAKTYPGVCFSDSELEITALYRKIAESLVGYDAVVFHGSAVEVDGLAYLFTAKSGVGKTTHTRLWLKNISGACVINGDKPIVRFVNGIPFAYGTPWNGKERLGTNKAVPLKTICYLNRGNENRIEKVSASSVVEALLKQFHWNDTLFAVRFVSRLSETVCFYRLWCNMEDKAAVVSYEGMK